MVAKQAVFRIIGIFPGAPRQLAGAERIVYDLICMQHFVYAIYNKDHSKTYIGETNNLEERIRIHNEHKFAKSYTARFDGTWKLIYFEACSDRIQARKREKQLKSYQGRQFIKQFIPW